MARIKERMNISLSTKDKKFIIDKSEKMGFSSVSSFLIDSAKTYFRLNIDMSIYQKLTKEINYIGKNINAIVRRINADKIYTDSDIKSLTDNQEKIIKLMNEEYGKLLQAKYETTSETLNIKDKEMLIKELKKHEVDIPKKLILEEIYESIKSDFLYIGEEIDRSPLQEKEVSEYVWQYIYSKTIYELEEKNLIDFSNHIFLFSERIKIKNLKEKHLFDDEDWYELKNILDEYEIQ